MEQSTSGTTLALAIAAALGLVGCGGNESSNSVSIAFATESQVPDPVVLDFPVAYVSRELNAETMNNDTRLERSIRDPDIFVPGAALMLKERAEPSAASFNLLEIFGDDASRFDVRDIESDYDGSRLIFSMRGPFLEDADDDEQPSWNIWIYDRQTDELRRVIESDTQAEAGHDRDPYFLPDGRIVFTSNRQRRARAILLDEGRPQFAALDEDRSSEAFVLHTMSDDGTDIEQISFNQSHDQDPTVHSDGRIIFTRWDNVPGRDAFSLYQINPDGTALTRLYGYHSQQSGPDGETLRFVEPEPLDDDSLLVMGINEGGADISARLLSIDIDGHVEIGTATNSNAGSTSAGQRALFETALDGVSPAGRFAAADPLYDGTSRVLSAWSPCRLIETDPQNGATSIGPCPRNLDEAEFQETGSQEAAPLYGLWMFDREEETQQPVVTPQEGLAITEVAVMGERERPFVRLPAPSGPEMQDLVDRGMGVIDIRSVYDIDGMDAIAPGIDVLANPDLTPADTRPFQFVRLIKPVSIPGDDVIDIPRTAFGRSTAQLMREIIGYGIVHPDGSIRLEVPANVPFGLSLLDASGKRVSAIHRNWLQVRPGETLACKGCHQQDSTYPHGRPDAEAPSINGGAPWPGITGNLLIGTGATIAEGFAEQFGTPAPSANLVFEDIWSDEPAAGFALRYEDLQSPAPVSARCMTEWQANCRITPHYPVHIHPLWSVPRVEADADNSCTACHTPTDAMNAAQVPAAQLDLTDGPSVDQADHLKSYRELLFNDVEQEVVNGALIDRLVPVLDGAGDPVFETDEEGELILDAEGNPIPVLRTLPVRPSMFIGGAGSSSRFFSRFEAGGTHEGFMSPAELRLIAEWLDIGAQYYNDPFEAQP